MAPPSTKRQKREDYRKTHQETQSAEMPKKKFYRQRAHTNPFSDHQLTYPKNPAAMDWSGFYPAFAEPEPENAITGEGDTEGEEKPVRKISKAVTVADIGCGFGGLLVALSTKLPDELILGTSGRPPLPLTPFNLTPNVPFSLSADLANRPLPPPTGLEIRTQVLTYVTDRISAIRQQHLHPSSTSPSTLLTDPPLTTPKPTPYQNISALRANTMKFLPNFFPRHSLSKLFLCFPDPHFKNRKKKARIVSKTLCAEYAFVVRPGGYAFTITDVEELGAWMEGAFERSGGEGEDKGWERVVCGDAEVVWKGRGEGELDEEVEMCVEAMLNETEEGKKVTRVGGRKFIGVWRRREDPPWP